MVCTYMYFKRLYQENERMEYTDEERIFEEFMECVTRLIYSWLGEFGKGKALRLLNGKHDW